MIPIYYEDKTYRRTYNEIIPNVKNEAFVFRIFKEDKIHDFRHTHNEFEVIYIRNGCGTKTIGDNLEECSNGDIALIGEGVSHYYTIDPVDPRKKIEAWVIQFDKLFFGQQFFSYSETIHLKNLIEAAQVGVSFSKLAISKAIPLWHKLPKASGIDRLTIFLELMGTLSKPGNYHPIIGSGKPIAEKISNYRMDRVKQFIQQHFAKPISLSELSGLVNLSKPAFCNLFKKTFNVCYSSYLSETRLSHAAKLIAETDKPVSEIIDLTGFKNQTYFNRCFKKQFRKTPLEYRKSLISYKL